ncbi:hypothetical protein SDC9_115226 [bioreactor metagenome]|uniref:Uncharacterized protein n=1 Tax=bioreactor metagenome TaxID=1076179 RepID=A0A645BSJ2_9ZZZZ
MQRVIVALQRRRGRAEHHRGLFELAPHHRHVPGGIARRFGLFVGAFMLLVDHDQTEVGKRGEQRRTGADHDPDLSVPDAVPLRQPFAAGKAAVHHAQRVAEARPEAAHRLRRERNFRHQHDGGAPQLQRPGDGLEIDFGLARTGDAEKQSGVGRFSGVIEQSEDAVQRFALFRRRFARRVGDDFGFARFAAEFDFDFGVAADGDQTGLEQRLQYGRRGVGFGLKLFERASGSTQQFLKDDDASRGGFFAGVGLDEIVAAVGIGDGVKFVLAEMLAGAAHRAGEQRPDRLFPGAAVVIGHPAAEFEQRFGNLGGVGAESGDRLECNAGVFRPRRQRQHAAGFTGVSERHQHPRTRPDLGRQFVRHQIVEAPVEREIDDDFGDQHG